MFQILPARFNASANCTFSNPLDLSGNICLIHAMFKISRKIINGECGMKIEFVYINIISLHAYLADRKSIKYIF